MFSDSFLYLILYAVGHLIGHIGKLVRLSTSMHTLPDKPLDSAVPETRRLVKFGKLT